MRTTTTTKTKRAATTKSTEPAAAIPSAPREAFKGLARKFIDGTIDAKTEACFLASHLSVMHERAVHPAPASGPNWLTLTASAYALAGSIDLEAKRTGEPDALHEFGARAWELATELRARDVDDPELRAESAQRLAKKIAATPALRAVADKCRGAARDSMDLAADALRAQLAYEHFASVGEAAGNFYVPSRAFMIEALEVYAAECKAVV